MSNRCQKSQLGNGLALLVCGIGLLLVSSAAVDEVEEAGAVDRLAANGLSNDGWRFDPLKERLRTVDDACLVPVAKRN